MYLCLCCADRMSDGRYAALNYYCFETYKKALLPSEGGPQWLSGVPGVRLFCGSAAGATSVLITYPLDLARARLAYGGAHRGIWHSLAAWRQENGWRGLYKGFGPTWIGIFPYAGASFWTFDTIKLALLKQ